MAVCSLLSFLSSNMLKHLRDVSLVRGVFQPCHTFKPIMHRCIDQTTLEQTSVYCYRLPCICSFTIDIDDYGEPTKYIKADFRQSCTDTVYDMHFYCACAAGEFCVAPLYSVSDAY